MENKVYSEKSRYKESRNRGSELFPFQHYEMRSKSGNLFIPYHWHEELEFLYVIKGEANLLVNGEACHISEGDIIFLNPGDLHQISSTDLNIYYYAYVFPLDSLDFQVDDYAQKMFLTPLREERRFPLRLDYTSSCYTQVRREIQDMININVEKSVGYQLQTKADIYRIISVLMQEGLFLENDRKKNEATKEIRELLRFLHTNYDRPICLEEAAAMIHVTPSYFCTFFKKNFGKSFIEYRNHLRIEHACILLKNEQLPVTEVAFRVGVENISYFIRMFKRIMGITPLQYREEEKNKPKE